MRAEASGSEILQALSAAATGFGFSVRKMSCGCTPTRKPTPAAVDVDQRQVENGVCRRVVKDGEQVTFKMDVVCDGVAESCNKLKNDFNVMTARMQAEVDSRIRSGDK